MIVKDKESTINLANQISSKLLSIITEEIKTLNISEDPAEQIYLGSHIVGSLFSKVVLALEGYGKIYNIGGLNADSIYDWINVIAKENIELNK
jgi:hypothetical protein